MKELYSYTEEHPGNESWITNSITVFREDEELIFRHKHTAKGSWFDSVREVREIVLSKDFTFAQKQINLYLKKNLLTDKFSINLLNLI